MKNEKKKRTQSGRIVKIVVDFGDFWQDSRWRKGKKSTAETAKYYCHPTRSKAKPKMYCNL